jgi:hypothetical protein
MAGEYPFTPQGLGANFRRNLGDLNQSVYEVNSAMFNLPKNVLGGLGNFLKGAVTGDGGPAPARVPQPQRGAPQAAAARKATAPAPQKTPEAAQRNSVDPRAPVGAPTFDEMVSAYAAANGGQISLRQMSALADITQKTATRTRAPTIRDIAGQQALDLGAQLRDYRIGLAQEAGDKNAYLSAIQQHQDMLERLANSRAIDPMTAYGFDEGQ